MVEISTITAVEDLDPTANPQEWVTVSFSICNTEQEPRATHWHQRIWTTSFGFASCSCQRPLPKASKQDFIKAAFQGSIEIQMNLFPLSWISESSFPREGRGNIIRKGNYSYFTRGSRSTVVILYLVIFLTTVLWKAHKQKWQQTSMKYCALYIIKFWGGREPMASFNPAFVAHTTPSGRHSIQNVMQNQAIPGSLARGIHYTAENFHFSASLLTELTKSEKICHKTRAVLWWGHQTVLFPSPTNFFTGIYHNSQEQKVGSTGRCVELREGCT